MDGCLFLNVVVRHGPFTFELFSGKYEPLLIGWDAFLILDLGFDTVDCFRSLNFNCYGFPGQCLDKDLHCAEATEQGKCQNSTGSLLTSLSAALRAFCGVYWPE